MTSVHEDWPMPGNTAYCLSKGGMRMLTRTAGVELAPHNVLVVGVGPGAVETPINTATMADPAALAKLDAAIPIGRMAKPEEIGSVVAFLAGTGPATSPPPPSSPTAASCSPARACEGSPSRLGSPSPDSARPGRGPERHGGPRRNGAGTHRVVVVGGGFGGLPAIRLLGGKPVDVTLVDRRNHHLFQPLLYQTATGMLSPGQIAPALRHIVRKEKNVQVQLAEVDGFDLDRRVVHATVAGKLSVEYPYDSLIVAAGVTQSYFGQDEFALFAPGMKTLDDAVELRRRIFGAFEVAEMIDEPAEKKRWLTVVMVGAGPTGVELAGQVRELATRNLRGEFRTFEASSVRVILVDGGTEPLATFGDQLSGKAAKTLEHLGVELRMGARVVGIDAGGVDVKGRMAPIASRPGRSSGPPGSRPLRWPNCWPRPSGASVDRAGRIEVLPDLSLPGHPEVFAVGDMASLDKLPGVAEVAMQGGLHAANTILRRLKGKDTKTFRYRDSAASPPSAGSGPS